MATTLANPQDVNSGLTTDVTNSSSSSNLPSTGSQQGMVQSSAPANAGKEWCGGAPLAAHSCCSTSAPEQWRG